MHDVFAAAKSCVDGASEAVIKGWLLLLLFLFFLIFLVPARTAVAHYGVHVLLGAIAKHLADARFQDGRSKERIAQVYVPFLLVLIKEWNSSSGVLKDVPALMGLRRNVYLIVMWILEGCLLFFYKKKLFFCEFVHFGKNRIEKVYVEGDLAKLVGWRFCGFLASD